MNNGPMQRAVRSVFNAEPDARLTVREVAARIYPDRETIGVTETNTTNRILRQLAPVLGLTRVRVGLEGGAWQHVWGQK